MHHRVSLVAKAATVRIVGVSRGHLSSAASAVAQTRRECDSFASHTGAFSSAVMRVVFGQDGLNELEGIPIDVTRKMIFDHDPPLLLG